MLKNVSLSNRLIISLGILATVLAYLIVSKSDLIYALYAGIILTSVNLLLITKRIIISIIIMVVQALFITSFVYAMETSLNPATSIFYTLLALTVSVAGGIILFYKALGRHWVNLTIAYPLFDVMVLLYYPNMGDGSGFMYLALSIIVPTVVILIKNLFIARKIIKPAFYPSSDINNLGSVKLTSMLKQDNIDYAPVEGFITRTISVGNKTLVVYEPESRKPSRITSEGLYLGGNNYASFLENLIVETKKLAKSFKLKNKNIMPIIIIQDFKKNKIVSLKVYSTFKPDIKIGEVYACSPESLVSMVKNMQKSNTAKTSN